MAEGQPPDRPQLARPRRPPRRTPRLATRVRIRQSDLDTFIAGGSTIPDNSADERSEPETDATGAARQRVETAAADVLDIGTTKQPTDLAAALRELAAAANDLADSLNAPETR
jgi:hypothetical protein